MQLGTNLYYEFLLALIKTGCMKKIIANQLRRS